MTFEVSTCTFGEKSLYFVSILTRELLPKLAFLLYDFALTVIEDDSIFHVDYNGVHEQLGNFDESVFDSAVFYQLHS